jgi:thiol:disulfide interchange protein DsbC
MKKVVEQRKDIAFYLILYPLVQIHPEAYKKTRAVMCEKSPVKALEMLEDAYAKKNLPDPSCKTRAIDENLKLGKLLGINSTPTLIMPNGAILGRISSAEDIIAEIDKLK